MLVDLVNFPHGCARGGYVTQIAQIARIFCIASLAGAAGAGSYSPCPAGRNLVNLINLFLRDSVRVRGWFKSSGFL